MAGLYIHIPFCHSKCIYCDFYSVANPAKVDRVADALIHEFNARRSEIAEKFDTIYIGGGTPSILSDDTLAHIVEALPVEGVSEFTIEANPEDISHEKVAHWKSLGINRVSMGLQSLDDDTLRWMRRRHDAATAIKAVDTIKNVGIDNISVDLIYGLPRLEDSRWEDTLARVLKLPIDHLSAYCLTYHESTALSIRQSRGLDLPPSDDDIARQYDALCDLTSKGGFEHYEISNFATDGRRSRHNSLYWSSIGTWLGIGPSAHSFDGNTRRIDYADINRWLETSPQPFEIDSETALDRTNDYIVSGLRTAEGIDLNYFSSAMAQSILKDARHYIDMGYMSADDGHLKILPQFWLISDSFIRDMIRICEE